MRHPATVVLLSLLLAGSAGGARATETEQVLGAEGELYGVQVGTYKSLFANPPAGWGSHPVVALDIRFGTKQQRVLVPGTEGPEKEESPRLAVERATNQGYVVWVGQGALNVIGFGTEGWGDILELAAEAGSVKRNPQLAVTVDRYRRLGPDDEPVQASRTILHLVWSDLGAAGERLLYAPLVVEDGTLRSGHIFDLLGLVGGPGEGAAAAGGGLQQRPRVRAGDNGVVIGFVPPGGAELVTLELRFIAGELAYLADKARAVVIDYGVRNPGLGRGPIADKARAVVIDYGRRLLKPTLAEVVVKTFLDRFAATDESLPLEEAADLARAALLEEGVALRIETADGGAPRYLEIARGAAIGSTTHLLDVRPARRRALPDLGDGPLPQIVLSPDGADVALAWTEGEQVRYRESGAEGWSRVKSLAVGGAFGVDQAFKLLEQRLEGH